MPFFRNQGSISEILEMILTAKETHKDNKNQLGHSLWKTAWAAQQSCHPIATTCMNYCSHLNETKIGRSLHKTRAWRKNDTKWVLTS